MTATTVPVGIHSQAKAGKTVPPAYAEFVAEFYRRTDIADDSWLDMLTPDIKCTVYEEHNGRDQLREARSQGAKNRKDVQHRFHHIMLVDPNVAFVTGDIDFTIRATGEVVSKVPWVARMTFNGNPEDLKVKDYYVWVHVPPPKL